MPIVCNHTAATITLPSGMKIRPGYTKAISEQHWSLPINQAAIERLLYDQEISLPTEVPRQQILRPHPDAKPTRMNRALAERNYLEHWREKYGLPRKMTDDDLRLAIAKELYE